MDKNACIGCANYERCGRPDRMVRCLGYEQDPNYSNEREETGEPIEKSDIIESYFRLGRLIIC